MNGPEVCAAAALLPPTRRVLYGLVTNLVSPLRRLRRVCYMRMARGWLLLILWLAPYVRLNQLGAYAAARMS